MGSVLKDLCVGDLSLGVVVLKRWWDLSEFGISHDWPLCVGGFPSCHKSSLLSTAFLSWCHQLWGEPQLTWICACHPSSWTLSIWDWAKIYSLFSLRHFLIIGNRLMKSNMNKKIKSVFKILLTNKNPEPKGFSGEIYQPFKEVILVWHSSKNRRGGNIFIFVL